MIFGVLNPEKIWYHQLVHLSTSPEYCSLFTFGNPKKVIFQQYYSYIHQIIYVISEENKRAHVNIVHRIVSYRTQGRLKWYRSIGHVGEGSPRRDAAQDRDSCVSGSEWPYLLIFSLRPMWFLSSCSV